MPTHIYRKITDSPRVIETVGGVGEGDWELPSQITELENWLSVHHKELSKGSYVADIGFTLREGACGGGAIMTRQLIAILNEVGMEVYFSEYWLCEADS